MHTWEFQEGEKNVTYKLFTNVMNILWILHLTINEVWICHLNIYSLQFCGFLLVSWNHFFFFFKISNISLSLKGLEALCTVPVVPHRYNAADAHSSSSIGSLALGSSQTGFCFRSPWSQSKCHPIQEAFLDPSLESSHPLLFYFSL